MAQFADVQISASDGVPPALLGAVVPAQRLPVDPPVRASGARVEFQGEGPFALERVQVLFESDKASAPTSAPPSVNPKADAEPAGPALAVAGQWIMAARGGLRRDAILVLQANGPRLSGFWDFSQIAGGLVQVDWNGKAFVGQAQLGDEGPVDLTMAISADGQRLNVGAKKSPSGAGKFALGFVKQPKPDQKDLGAWIKSYADQDSQIRSGGAVSANDTPDFSGIWVESAEADDTDLRHLRLSQNGLRVAGEFVAPKGYRPFQGVIRKGVLCATVAGPDGLKRCYRIQLSPSGDELTGFEGRYDGPIPGTPMEPWRRERASPEGMGNAHLGHAADLQ